MSDYQSQYPVTPPRQAAPWQIPHPATTATAAFPAIWCRCGRQVVRRRSRPGHLRLMRSHFAMSSRCPFSECFIIRYFCKRALLDVRYTSRIKSDPLEINRPFPIVSVILQ